MASMHCITDDLFKVTNFKTGRLKFDPRRKICLGLPVHYIRFLSRRNLFDHVGQTPPSPSLRAQNYSSWWGWDIIYSTVLFRVVGWGTMLYAQRSWVRFPVILLDFSIYLILPAALWPCARLSFWQKWVPGIFRGGDKEQPAHKAHNLTAICEPIFKKMWEPRRLTILWASLHGDGSSYSS
jgi:hypothetical protein